MKVGDLCLKIAGRDAGKRCVIIKNLGNSRVLIDGETRRKECNLRHLAPLNKTVSIKENASHEEVASLFKSDLASDLSKKKKSRESKSSGKPKKSHKKKEKPMKESKPKKKEEKAVGMAKKESKEKKEVK